MNDQAAAEHLEEVLDSYFTETGHPDPAALTRWIELFPQYERELTEFTVAWTRAINLQTADPPTDEETLVLRGMSVLQGMLQRQAAVSPGLESAAQEPLNDVVAAGAQLNLSLDDIADRAEMSPSLVWEVDRRLYTYATIPLQAIEALAHAVRRSVVSVARHLQGPPRARAGASYKSMQAPQVGAQRDFFDGVREARDLSDERRKRWLALMPPK